MDNRLVFMAVMVMAFMTPCIKGDGHLLFSGSLNTSITRQGCGTTKVCVAEPADCDPSVSTSCFFASSRSANTSSNATDLSFELSGNSTGYIALGLAASQSMPASIVFVCGNDNTSFFFRTASNSNATAGLEVTNSPNVDSIQNLINGSLIQCTFTARNLSSTSFSLTLFEGTTNGTVLESPRTVANASAVLNLSDPASNNNNNTATTAATTMTPATTADNGSAQNTLSHAVIALFSILTLRMLC